MRKYDRCDSLTEERLSLLAYGDLGPYARWRWRQHFKRCERCRRRFEGARLSARVLKSMGPIPAPADLVERVMARTAGRRKVPAIAGISLWRPLAAAALLIVLAVVVMRQPRFEEPPTYSEVEIQESRREIQNALGLLDRVLTRAQKRMTTQVIPERVIEPMKKSVVTVLQALTHGG